MRLKLMLQNVSILHWMRESATIYLDLAKAFDTVNHGNHLNKIQDIGLSESTIYLFKLFLENRKQVVKINDIFSSEELICKMQCTIRYNVIPDSFKYTTILPKNQYKMLKRCSCLDMYWSYL